MRFRNFCPNPKPKPKIRNPELFLHKPWPWNPSIHRLEFNIYFCEFKKSKSLQVWLLAETRSRKVNKSKSSTFCEKWNIENTKTRKVWLFAQVKRFAKSRKVEKTQKVWYCAKSQKVQKAKSRKVKLAQNLFEQSNVFDLPTFLRKVGVSPESNPGRV